MVLTLSIILNVGLIGILLFTSFRTVKKLEKQEDIIELQNKYILKILDTIGGSAKKLKEMDTLGAFEADDEVGYFFKALQDIQQELDNYVLESSSTNEQTKEAK